MAYMAIQCKLIPNFSCGPCTTKPMSSFSFNHFNLPQKRPLCVKPNILKLSTRRLDKGVLSAVVSEESAVESSYSGTGLFRLTHLEVNSWLWEVGGVKILDAAKKILKNFKLDNLPEIDCLLITQSLYDHCHLRTLKPSQKSSSLKLVATPNAKTLLDTLFSNVTLIVKDFLPWLHRFIVPLKNGNLDSKGLLAIIIQAEGTIESFKEMLFKELPNAVVLFSRELKLAEVFSCF